jgi:hypothetical protein
MTGYGPRELHIGVDAEKVVVAAYPLKMRRGRGRRRRTGSVTELIAVPASGRGREARIKFASQLALVLVVLSAVLDAAGIPWWTAGLGSVLIVALVAGQQARDARAGLVAVPPGDDRYMLVTAQERTAYTGALGVARRIRRTWPALAPMIDPVDADQALTRALDDLAAILARRQELRRLRAELDRVDHRGVPTDSPAVRALLEQRSRVDELWRETGATANRILAGLNAVALAGDNLLREQRIGVAANRAEATIAQLSVAHPVPHTATDELADRTAAVIAAYRELAAIK